MNIENIEFQILPYFFVLKQKSNKKIQGSVKFLTLIHSENAQKITLGV